MSAVIYHHHPRKYREAGQDTGFSIICSCQCTRQGRRPGQVSARFERTVTDDLPFPLCRSIILYSLAEDVVTDSTSLRMFGANIQLILKVSKTWLGRLPLTAVLHQVRFSAPITRVLLIL